MVRKLIRRVLFENLVLSLTLLLGAAQVIVGHWAIVVVGGRPGPGLVLGLALAAALVLANVLSLPIVRAATRRGGALRTLARAYVGVGFATIVLGGVIGAAWAGFVPLAALLGASGVAPGTVLGVFRIATVPVVAALVTMLIWGFTGGQAQIERTTLEVPVAGLSPSLRGLRIAHVSDLHVGNGMERERLARLVADVNALEADLIVLTGDLFDYDPAWVEHGARALAGLRARLGIFAVLGNHDVYTGVEHIVPALAEHAPNLRLLRGELVRLETDEPLYLAGVEDPGRDWTEQGLELAPLNALGCMLPDDGPTILLVHRPEAFEQAAKLGFPLVLAGHTHGGQVALPLRGGHWNPARAITRFYRGVYTHAEQRSILYVNRGVGTAGPQIRFNCTREIAVLTLRSGPG